MMPATHAYAWQIVIAKVYCQVTSSPLEVDDLAEHLITHVTITIDDLDGDGLSSHANPDVYNDKSCAASSLSMEERCNVFMPKVLSQH